MLNETNSTVNETNSTVNETANYGIEPMGKVMETYKPRTPKEAKELNLIGKTILGRIERSGNPDFNLKNVIRDVNAVKEMYPQAFVPNYPRDVEETPQATVERVWNTIMSAPTGNLKDIFNQQPKGAYGKK